MKVSNNMYVKVNARSSCLRYILMNIQIQNVRYNRFGQIKTRILLPEFVIYKAQLQEVYFLQ